MSYHTDEPQRRISPCQMDRMSTQGYMDRNRLYSRIPIYVNNSVTGTQDGSFENPYGTLQAALNAGGLANRVLVLQQGNYTMTQETINADVHMVTRSGPSNVSRVLVLQQGSYTMTQTHFEPSIDSRDTRGVQRYRLPVDLENSQNPQVRNMAKAVQNDDTSARKIMREAGEVARVAAKKEEKDAIISAAEAKRKQYQDNAVNHLLEAEKHATGDEKLAVQLELAQRYRDAGNYELAVQYYKLVAETTDQEYLREDAFRFAEKYSQELLKK